MEVRVHVQRVDRTRRDQSYVFRARDLRKEVVRSVKVGLGGDTARPSYPQVSMEEGGGRYKPILVMDTARPSYPQVSMEEGEEEGETRGESHRCI